MRKRSQHSRAPYQHAVPQRGLVVDFDPSSASAGKITVELVAQTVQSILQLRYLSEQSTRLGRQLEARSHRCQPPQVPVRHQLQRRLKSSQDNTPSRYELVRPALLNIERSVITARWPQTPSVQRSTRASDRPACSSLETPTPHGADGKIEIGSSGRPSIVLTLAPMPTPSLKNETVKVGKLVADYRAGRIVIREFQRDYVWRKNRAPRLIDSLYRRFPISTLLLWQSSEYAKARRSSPKPPPCRARGSERSREGR